MKNVLVILLLLMVAYATTTNAMAEEPRCPAGTDKQTLWNMISDSHALRHLKSHSAVWNGPYDKHQYSTVYKVTVEPIWYNLDIDQKETLNALVLCWLLADDPSKTSYLVYGDTMTGKIIATYSPSGFEIK